MTYDFSEIDEPESILGLIREGDIIALGIRVASALWAENSRGAEALIALTALEARIASGARI